MLLVLYMLAVSVLTFFLYKYIYWVAATVVNGGSEVTPNTTEKEALPPVFVGNGPEP